MRVRQIVPMARAVGDPVLPGTVWDCADEVEALRLAEAGAVEILDEPSRPPDPQTARQTVTPVVGGVTVETTSAKPRRGRPRGQG